MALVHEELYKSKNLSRLNANEYIRELAGSVMRTYGSVAERVSLELDMKDLDLDMEIAVTDRAGNQ